MEVTITKLWNFTATFRPKVKQYYVPHEALAHPSHSGGEILQHPENEQNTSKSELLQSGHGLRPDLHTALEPGSEILQDLNQAKFQPIRTTSTRS